MNYIKNLLIIGIVILSSNLTLSQTPTIGLLHHDSNVSDGFTLFTPEKSTNVYLINNCGEKINEWTFNEAPALTCYLLENGNLLRAGKDSLQIKDWNNNLVWSYPTTANGISQHHDIEPLPNGNILCVVADNYSKAAITLEGRNPSLSDGTFKLDKIIELQPVGNNNATIVWEWKFINHLIQDFDSTKLNYGIVENHPELIDINFDNGFNSDWIHLNGIDYNAALDQIIISARHMNEIYIIDHSTTSSEAAGHSGGNSLKGGDFLWRWGNPQAYRQGSSLDQKLFWQHDSKFVEQGYLDEGKISVFNNLGDGSGLFSSIHLITPTLLGNSYQMQADKFLPLDFEWSWNGSILGNVVNEGKKSGAHALPNGNFIFCETALGQISEINKNGDHLWTYKNPVASFVLTQNTTVTASANSIFRAEKYPENYAGFVGKNLTPQGIIEDQNSNSVACISTVGVNDIISNNIVITNPVTNGKIEFNTFLNTEKITVFDLNGKTVYSCQHFNGSSITLTLPPAMYFIQVKTADNIFTNKVVFR